MAPPSGGCKIFWGSLVIPWWFYFFKSGWFCLRVFEVVSVLHWGAFPPKFLLSLSGKTWSNLENFMRWCKNATDLYHQISHATWGKVMFFCPSGFWIKFVLMISPLSPLNFDMLLMALDKGMFVVLYLHRTLSLHPPLGGATTECWIWKLGQIWVFHPSWVTQCTNQDKIWCGRAHHSFTHPRQISRWTMMGAIFGRPKNWKFSKNLGFSSMWGDVMHQLIYCGRVHHTFTLMCHISPWLVNGLGKVKSTVPHPHEECWWGAHLPYLGSEAIGR